MSNIPVDFETSWAMHKIRSELEEKLAPNYKGIALSQSSNCTSL